MLMRVAEGVITTLLFRPETQAAFRMSDMTQHCQVSSMWTGKLLRTGNSVKTAGVAMRRIAFAL